jgi:hypothetical protein
MKYKVCKNHSGSADEGWYNKTAKIRAAARAGTSPFYSDSFATEFDTVIPPFHSVSNRDEPGV